MITGLDYWFDGQQRRFLEQIVRAFSGFHYETGWRDNTPPQQIMVPCRIASVDRTVANIMRNNSENTLLTVPLITVYQTGLVPRREGLHDTTHVDSVHATERGVDAVTGRYNGEKGRSYTVDRMMPRPFTMNVQVDIWTSNLNQKHQLSEQILTVIYPDFYIQNSDNALDWSSFTLMSVEDIVWTSRSLPIGSDSEIEVMTINLTLPFWLSPPVKVTQQRVIQQIVLNINESNLEDGANSVTNPLTRIITTPGNHFVRVEGNVLTLLTDKGAEEDGGEYPSWAPLLAQYGTLKPTQSQIRLKTNPDIESDSGDIIGTIQLGANPNELIFQIDPDTLPGNTLAAVDAVIDPMASWPGNGLPGAVNGRRYLLVGEVRNSLNAWGLLVAGANDIIQYENGEWSVVFNARSVTNEAPQFLINLNSGRQLRWTGYDWVLSIAGDYPPGMWRLSL